MCESALLNCTHKLDNFGLFDFPVDKLTISSTLSTALFFLGARDEKACCLPWHLTPTVSQDSQGQRHSGPGHTVMTTTHAAHATGIKDFLLLGRQGGVKRLGGFTVLVHGGAHLTHTLAA